MIAVGALLILGAGVWYLAAGDLLALQTPAEPGGVGEDPEAAIPRISLADAKAAHELGSAVFLDVRDANAYAQSHIKGAILIPLDELPDRVNELNPSDWIITYCT
jgi:hypothetical protein